MYIDYQSVVYKKAKYDYWHCGKRCGIWWVALYVFGRAIDRTSRANEYLFDSGRIIGLHCTRL